MRELQVLRRIYPESAPPSAAARARAWAALSNRIDAARPPLRPRFRGWQVALAGTALAAAAAVAVFVGWGTQGDGTASAATKALREAAVAARVRTPFPQPGPGRYLYVKSVDAYLGTNVYSGNVSFSVLVPHVREVWRGPEGGRLLVEAGEPRFLSERDRERWVSLGRPRLGEGNESVRLPAARPLELPADADALFERLRDDAQEGGSGPHDQMFTLVGDALREMTASRAQRAALYEVAARIPGVELVGRVTDRAGRPGIAVARLDEENAIRHTLVFDPETSALLEEEQVVTAGNAWDYPAGTVIGYSTYVVSAVVDELGERP